MVNPEIRNGIKKSNLPSTHEGGEVVQSASDNEKTQIGDSNQVSLLASEQRAERIEVAVSELLNTGSTLGRKTLVSSADIEQQI